MITESDLLRIKVLEYSIKTTTSLLTKWNLEDELKRLKDEKMELSHSLLL